MGKGLPTAAVLLGAFFFAGGSARAMDNTVADGGPDLTAVRALIKAERFQDAIVALKKLEREGPNSDVLNLLAFSQRKSGDFATAYANYQKALKLNPEHRSAREYLGELYIQTGQIEKARGELAILKRLCPRGCEELTDLEEALAAAQ